MPRDFIPRRDAKFLQFTRNFRDRIVEAPDPAALGLTSGQVAHYAQTQQLFDEAYRAAITPGTRTAPAVRAKTDARELLEDETRMLAAIIRAHPGVSAGMRSDLGLALRTERRKRVPRPAEPPILLIDSVRDSTIRLRLMDAESNRIGRPRDVKGATVLCFVGDDPPANPSRWRLLRQTSRARLTVAVSLPPGAKLWLSACWLGTRNERGPHCAPVSTYLSNNVPALGANARSLQFTARPEQGTLKQAA